MENNNKTGFFGTNNNKVFNYTENTQFNVTFKKSNNYEFMCFWNSLTQRQKNTVLRDFDYDVPYDNVIVDILQKLNIEIVKRSGFIVKKAGDGWIDVYAGFMAGLQSLVEFDVYDDNGYKLSWKESREVLYDDRLREEIIINIVD